MDDTTRLVFADWLEERGDPRAGWVRDLAIWRWMGPCAENPIPALIHAMTQPDSCQSEEIASVLQRIGSAAVPALVEALQTEDLAPWASSTLRGFRSEDLSPALPLIRQFAAEGNVSAIKLLAGVASEVGSVAPTLFERLGHSRQTIWLLGTTGPEAAPLLLSEAPRFDPALLACAADQLRQFGDIVTPLLRETLTDDDVRRRLLAATALAPKDPDAAAPHLVEALENDSLQQEVEECRVVSHFRGMGQVAAVFAPRLRLLLWKSGGRKHELLEILHAIDDPSELTAELFARLRAERWEERVESLDFLAQISRLRAERWQQQGKSSDALEEFDLPPAGALETALDMLANDDDVRVRRRATEAVADFAPYGHAGAIAAVIGQLRREGPFHEAIRTLGTLGAPNFVADLVTLCEHEDEEIRRTALATMVFADGSHADAAAALCRALDREPDGHYAVDHLCDRPPSLGLAVEEIVSRVRGDRPTPYHLKMVSRLEHLSGDEQMALLCRHLDDDNLVATALEELANVSNGHPPIEAMPALLRLLDASGNRGAYRTAALLAWIGEPAAPELARRLKDDAVSEMAAYGLSLMHARAAGVCDALIEALRTGNEQTRRYAATALGNIGPAAMSAVSELRRATRGISAWMRALAAEALGKIGAKEALSDLHLLLSDTSQHARNCAAKAINEMTCEPREETSGDEIPF